MKIPARPAIARLSEIPGGNSGTFAGAVIPSTVAADPGLLLMSPEYDAVRLAEPWRESEYETAQPQTEMRHCPEDGENFPVGLDVANVTGPLGITPRTTALQVVDELAGTCAGRQNADM